MSYLDPVSDLDAFGLADGVTQETIDKAGDLIDAYLFRPEGLTYEVDWAGQPAFMSKATPRFVLSASAAIAPGQNVVVPVVEYFSASDMMGEVLVLDAGLSACEVCVVNGFQAPTPGVAGSVTLRYVAQPHASGFKLKGGLAIQEDRKMPSRRSVTRVSRPFPSRLLSLAGRYGYGRRSDQVEGVFNDTNLLSTLSAFGVPPMWEYVDASTASFNLTSGEVWVPAGIMLAYFTDVKIWYLAGWPAANVPSNIKRACALVCNEIVGIGDFPSGLTSQKAGGQEIRRGGGGMSAGGSNGPRRQGANPGYLTDDAKTLVNGYRCRTFA